MFYQCPQCKKKWQYLIEKCPDCFFDLERMKSEKIKVISVSKVNIPTLFHPKVPYFVLVLEDENGNKWVQKSVQEYKIGDLFKTEPCTNKNAVAVWRIKYDILEAIEKAVELLGGININQRAKVLILPSLTSPAHPHFAENTSPQFLESAIKFLLEKGIIAENIKVVGQSFDKVPIEISVQKSQLLRVCQDCKVLPLDLAKTNFVKRAESNLNFEISEEVFSSDLILNLPILKTGKTSASDNILKFLKKENYLGLKYLYSDEEILENLNKVLFTRRPARRSFSAGGSSGEGWPSSLTIADGQVVQKSNKFTAFLGLALASFNSLNLDRVFAEIVMLQSLPESLKKVKIEDIPIVGRRVEETQIDIEKM